jgi:hypothetical protein
MQIPPIESKAGGLRPGRAVVRLGPEHLAAYRLLYSQYRTIFDSLPVLRESDFDGRAISMPAAQAEALNRAFASVGSKEDVAKSAFEAQEQARQRLSKRLQYLS